MMPSLHTEAHVAAAARSSCAAVELPLHRDYPVRAVVAQIWRGSSLHRAMFHLAVSRHRVSGAVLDLGAKSPSASYYRHTTIAQEANVVFTDLRPPDGSDVVQLDVESRFPFPDRTFDAVFAFNLLEHVFDHAAVFEEAARVLRRGGRFLVSVPFLHEFHGDPDDFVRFTDSGLRRLAADAALEVDHLEALGDGIATFGLTKLGAAITPRRFRRHAITVGYLAGVCIDRVVALRPAVARRRLPARFPLSYFAVFRKGR